MDPKSQTKKFFSEWLEKIQQESWQLELIISGLAIYGLFSVKDYIENFGLDIYDGAGDFSFLLIGVIFSILTFGVLIFIINLIFHVIVRGLWIGAIGLRYVSGEIEYYKLNYSKRFQNFYQKKVGDFDLYIEKLEKLASSLFSFTFLLFFILLSFLLFIFQVSAFGQLADRLGDPKVLSILTFIHVLFGFIVAVDFIFMGFLKRIKWKWFAIPYFFIFRYISFLTLSFIWRPIYLNFLDEKYTRRLFFLTIPYCIGITCFSSMESINVGFFPETRIVTESNEYQIKNSYNWQFYDEELENYGKMIKIPYFTIPSKRVTSSVFQVFIRMYSYDDEIIMEADSTLIPFRKKGLTLSSTNLNLSTSDNDIGKIKSILKEHMAIEINNQEVDKDLIDCDFYTHPHNKIVGLLCFFPIDSLERGRNYLTVEKDNKTIGQRDSVKRISYTIPFIYDN